MPWIAAGGALLGGLFTSNANKKAAKQSANAQVEAARIAADAARFRPVGMTTRFGSSQFGYDPQGNLSSAGYTVSPELAAMRDQLLSQAGGAGMGTAQQAQQAGQGLFGLGQQYLAQSPQEAAQSWMQSQQALLAPENEQALAGVRNQLFQTGRSGLATGATQAGGMAATNPEMAAYYNALAKQNLGLAAQAQEQGRAQTTFGQGLLGAGIDLQSQGYNPFKTQFGLAQSLEQAGQAPLELSASLAGRSAQAGGNVGQTLFTGGTNAATALQAANKYSPVGGTIAGLADNKEFIQGLSNWWNRGSTSNNLSYGPSNNPSMYDLPTTFGQ